jgi:two-component system, response regulator
VGSEGKASVILLADDDPDDRDMTRKALERSRPPHELHTVADGEELLDFLHHRGRYSPPALSPTPGLILLDLNMPRKDGREALAEIKANPMLRRIPVVVMTTSQAKEDIFRTYDLGGSSFISKPIAFTELVEVVARLTQYWFETVTLADIADQG